MLRKNPQHSNILNIALTIKQLNLKFKKIGWGAQKFMGAQKLLRDHDASASLRHPQMAPGRDAIHVGQFYTKHENRNSSLKRCFNGLPEFKSNHVELYYGLSDRNRSIGKRNSMTVQIL